MATRIRINERQVQDIRNLLGDISNGAERAMRTALNRTLDGAVTLTAKRIGETVTLKSALIKSNITKERATNYELGAMMRMRSKRIPLAAFSTNPSVAASQTRDSGNGVSVKVWKTRPTVRFRHAFFARMPNGYIGLFERQGTKRLPIDELVGPYLASVYENTPGLGAEVEQTSAERLQRELDHQVTFLLGLNSE